jgi:hypothetical protein
LGTGAITLGTGANSSGDAVADSNNSFREAVEENVVGTKLLPEPGEVDRRFKKPGEGMNPGESRRPGDKKPAGSGEAGQRAYWNGDIMRADAGYCGEPNCRGGKLPTII